MKVYKIIGLMSGTSLDGLDLAYCHIWKTGHQWKFDLKQTKSIPYSKEMQERLKDSILLPAYELLIFHNTYGTWLGNEARTFIEEHDLDVDYIASHGHTTHHRPHRGLTFQIGSGQHLANACNLGVVCDFRTNDVALGGQGAPLVPIGDALFFGQYDFCLNLGGISNVSFDRDGTRLAYDIGLANMILNHIARKNGLDYDQGGTRARSGQVNQKMLNKLNALAYYRLPFPKSVGYEWFLEKVVPIIDATTDSLENLLCSSVHHIGEQVALQIKANSQKERSSLFVTGGGALNDFLIETLQGKLGKNIEVIVPPKELIEFKEALVFALMGVLRLEGSTNVLCSVTGAERNSSSGVVFFPN